jgi:hypothetical protein
VAPAKYANGVCGKVPNGAESCWLADEDGVENTYQAVIGDVATNGANAFRTWSALGGETQNCQNDLDCIAQGTFLQQFMAFKACGADGLSDEEEATCMSELNPEMARGWDRGQCAASATCTPSVVAGYQMSKMVPSKLWGEGVETPATLESFIESMGGVTFENSGEMAWEGKDKIKFNRWVVKDFHAYRDNCDAVPLDVMAVAAGADPTANGYDPTVGSPGWDCDTPLSCLGIGYWNGDFGLTPPMAACAAPLKVNPSMEGTATDTVGPYDPRDKLDGFEMPEGIDPVVYIDTWAETGSVIRANQPLTIGFQITAGLIFADVETAFIPHNLLHRHGQASPKQLEDIEKLVDGFKLLEGLDGSKTMATALLGVGVVLLLLGCVLALKGGKAQQ